MQGIRTNDAVSRLPYISPTSDTPTVLGTMGQNQTAQQPRSNSPLSQPGSHGYPMRFGLRLAGIQGFKIHGADPKQAFRYVK